MPDPDYTNWPIEADVTARLARAAATLRVSGADATAAIAAQTLAVTGEVARRTLRQFVADVAPVSRYFDGCGTAMLEVDEFVTFVGATAIGLNADPGYPLANVIVSSDLGKPQTRLIRGQGGLPAFQVAAVYQPIPTIFPLGRQNIAISAIWGFAASIPADLWEAVACEIARRLLSEAIFTQDAATGGAGVVKQIKGGDEAILYSGTTDVTGWSRAYDKALGFYRRRPGRMLRAMRPPMT